MKIKYLSCCVGPDGEVHAAGETQVVDEGDAKYLIALGRAEQATVEAAAKK